MQERSGIAIIGMACRFPGAPDLDAFWRNLIGGVESIAPLSDAALTAAGVAPRDFGDPDYVKAASLLGDIECFDAPFFEYSAQEARIMDPQQRLLLQAAWHAFEDAGRIPGGDTGVFVGCGGVVSSYLIDRVRTASELPGYTGSLSHLGNDKDFASTRISYKLNLKGPSINVQTACSTSLVAVHLACQSILSGECSMALAGASAIRVPQQEGYVAIKGGILSPDGHCRPFDADAAGTVFGSGVGAVLLKDLEQALADRDPIYAVIRGSAVNNDGADKISFTASSVPGQARAMVEAIGVAGMAPDEIDYVECHGTGTIIGDPLEISALTRAFRTTTQRKGYCAIGSVKGNLGHLEQCAGMAGLIKTALSLRHGFIPPSLNFRRANPKIDFEQSPFFVNTQTREWKRNGHARQAAVNSLGLGGTNAFLLLEEAPAAEPPQAKAQAELFVVSAKTAAALQQALTRHAAFIESNPDIPPSDMGRTLACGRLHHPFRFAVTAESLSELGAQLSKASLSGTRDALATPRKLAFLFSGQASQYAGMGAELYRTEKAFREIFDRCDRMFRQARGESLKDIVFSSEASPRLDETGNTQPALFAIQAGLVELWRSFGITPDAVIGHSIGELAAAYCAGVFSLEDAFALVLRRADLMQALPRGAMASIAADEATVSALMRDLDCRDLVIGGFNAPELLAVSGSEADVMRLIATCGGRGIAAQRLSVSHAFHSPHMQPIAADLRAFASRLKPASPSIEWISTLTGHTVTGIDADYWSDQALQPVRYRDAVLTLAAKEDYDFIEIGPGSAMLSLGRQSCAKSGLNWLPSLLRGKERRTLLSALGALYVSGREIDWPALYGDGPRISLPAYPFEPHRYWLEPGAGTARHDGNASLTGTRMRSASREAIFESACGLREFPYLADHIIYGHPVLPFTAALTALHGAARELFQTGRVSLAEIQYGEAMVVPEQEPAVTQTILAPVADGRADGVFASLAGDTWQTHVTARTAAGSEDDAPSAPDLAAIRSRCTQDVPADRFYELADALGLGYGPTFRGITSLQIGQGEALAEVELPADVALPPDGQHPALLDACLHIFAALAPGLTAIDSAQAQRPSFLPVGLERFTMHETPSRKVFVHAVRRPEPSPDHFGIDIAAFDDAGNIVANFQDLTLKRLAETEVVRSAKRSAMDWLYRMEWKEASDEAAALASTPRSSWLILADDGGTGAALAQYLENRGDSCRLIHASEANEALQAPDCIEALSQQFLTAIEQSTRTYLPPLRGVIDLWPLDSGRTPEMLTDIEPRQRRMIAGGAALLRALANAPRNLTVSVRAYFVTIGRPADAMAGSVWGLGRSAALEFPQFFGGLIDLDPNETPQQRAERLAGEILHGRGEDQVAIRDGRRLVARLVRAKEPDEAARIEPEAQYLVTGGLGIVGTELARWLATRHRVRQIGMVSRRGADDPRAAELKAELAASGTQLVFHKADVVDERAMTALFNEIAQSPLPLKGVFHCAGLLDDGVLAQMDWKKFWRVMAPKIEGGALLDKLTRRFPLDHFVMFSSILSLIGSAGQANYAAANTFLDALVDRRRGEGLPALGLNWGPWAGEGLATASGERGRAIWRARGTQYLEADLVRSAFDALIGRADGHAAITVTDWPKFFEQFQNLPPLYAELARGMNAPRRKRKQPTHADLRARLDAASSDERRALVTDFLHDAVSDALGSTQTLDPQRPLSEYGLDSLIAVTLINEIDTVFGVRIPMTRMIKGPNLLKLADGILADLGHASEPLLVFSSPGAADGATMNGAAVNGARWLTKIASRPAPKVRLFCFPFAGGGSAVFQNWAPLIRSDVDLIAVEPPGRLRRIDESPVSDIEPFVDQVLDEMQGQLDTPFAFFGHCLGGLTMYETARRLRNTTPFSPRHLFVSGARPPDCVFDQGAFERDLLRELSTYSGFRLNAPVHAQPDDVFARVIRHFNIYATEQLLEQKELRELMLPAIRAEFRMANNYVYEREDPWDIPITCFYGKDDAYVTREQALGWGRFTDSRFRAHIREGAHFGVIDDMKFITETINRELSLDSNSRQNSAA